MDIRQVVFYLDVAKKLPLSYGHYLRGYFANNFSDVLFHNHLSDEQLRYGYPLIQYKILQGKPTVIGFERGAKLVGEQFFEIEAIRLGDQEYRDLQKGLNVYMWDLAFADTLKYHYKFITPWLGLNQKNYKIYRQKQGSVGFNEKEFFQKILVGNILSFAKSVDWWVETRIFVLPNLKPVTVNYKNQKMVGFTGEFFSNIALPSLMGLGNSSSRGFGTIQRMEP